MNTLTSQSYQLQGAMTDALKRLNQKPDGGRALRLFDLSCFPSVHLVNAWPLTVLSHTAVDNEGCSYWLTSEFKIMAYKNRWWLPRALLSEVCFTANGRRDELLLETLIDNVENL